MRVGQYEVVAAIGAGGMGGVYKARDTRLQCDVALEVLPRLLANATPIAARVSSVRAGARRAQLPRVRLVYPRSRLS